MNRKFRTRGFLRVLHVTTKRAVAMMLIASLSSAPWALAQGNGAAPTPRQDALPFTLLDEVVVTPTRSEEPASRVTSAYTLLGGEEIKRTQIPTVKQALSLAQGLMPREQGAQGATTAVSIRGNRSVDTLYLVDGMKADSVIFGNGGSPLLSFATTYNVESLEVVRGPHSSLFGTEAIGGIVSLETKRGQGRPLTTLFFEGGSFNTFREGVLSSGALGKLDYSLHFAREDSSNDRPNNDLRVNSESLRLDYTVSKDFVLGLSVRTQNGEYQDPGGIRPVDVPYKDPNASSKAEATILSTYAEWRATDIWTTKLTLGTYQERYTFNNPYNPESYLGSSTPAIWTPFSYSYPYLGYFAVDPDFSNSQDSALMKSENWSADWKNTIDISERNRLLAGAAILYQSGHYDYDLSYVMPPPSWSNYTLDQKSNGSSTDVGLYIEDQWEVIDQLTVAASMRYDHIALSGNGTSSSNYVSQYYSSADQTAADYDVDTDVLTYRLGAAYLLKPTRTKFHAGFGTAFKEPTLVQMSTLQDSPNKNLDPERSKSWDAGVDQYFLKDRLMLGATFFQSRIDNLLAYVSRAYPLPGYYVNAHEARSYGIETALTAKLTERWLARVVYTWTESEQSSLYWTSLDDVELGGMQRVPRVPRHVLSADTNYTFDLPVGKLTLGAGVFAAAQRKDVDPAYARPVIVDGNSPYAGRLVGLEDYWTARLYGRYELNERIAFTARVENLTNEQYQPIVGYPALGRGIYGGVQISF